MNHSLLLDSILQNDGLCPVYVWVIREYIGKYSQADLLYSENTLASSKESVNAHTGHNQCYNRPDSM